MHKFSYLLTYLQKWLFVIKDGAEYSNIGLPEEMEMRLRFRTQTVTTNKAQKHHSGKKTASSEQVCRQKKAVGDESTHTDNKCITLVFPCRVFL